MKGIPNTPVVGFRTINYESMVVEMWGPAWNMNDIAYEMSNGRKFECTDKYATGIYGVSGVNFLMIQDSRYPDMASNSHLLQQTGYRIELQE